MGRTGDHVRDVHHNVAIADNISECGSVGNVRCGRRSMSRGTFVGSGQKHWMKLPAGVISRAQFARMRVILDTDCMYRPLLCPHTRLLQLKLNISRMEYDVWFPPFATWYCRNGNGHRTTRAESTAERVTRYVRSYKVCEVISAASTERQRQGAVCRLNAMCLGSLIYLLNGAALERVYKALTSNWTARCDLTDAMRLLHLDSISSLDANDNYDTLSVDKSRRVESRRAAAVHDEQTGNVSRGVIARGAVTRDIGIPWEQAVTSVK